MNKVEKPWGYYLDLLKTDTFNLKFISINPLAAPSYQRHKYRSETWIIQKGQGILTKNDIDYLVKKGETVHIDVMIKHQMRNISSVDVLEFIEIQNGESFEESDIERFKDDYGREDKRE